MEEQAEYITEAMQLLHGEPTLEVEAPRKITERRDGKLIETERAAFVKVYTTFKKELKDLDGGDLKIWLYLALSINRFTKDARPGLRKIAEETGMAVNTVRAGLERLELCGLLDVARTDGKTNAYHPSDYVSVSKTDTVPETVSKTAGTVSKNRGTVSVTRKDFAQLEELESTRDDAPRLSSKDYERANAMVDAIIANSGRVDTWEGREIFAPQTYALVDWYHSVTGQTCPKSKRKDWMRAVTMWQANQLTVDHLQAAYDMDVKWRGVFTSPNQLTEKAIALKAQRQVKPIEMVEYL